MFPVCSRQRVVFGIGDFFLGREKPIGGERLLEMGDDIPTELELRIAPESCVRTFTGILRTNVHPADKRDPPIEDLELSMVAQIDKPRVTTEGKRVKPREMSSRS